MVMPTKATKRSRKMTMIDVTMRNAIAIIVLNRPERLATNPMPPPFATLRALPSFPPDRIRQLRRDGMLENDFTSRVRIKGEENMMPLVQFTRAPALVST